MPCWCQPDPASGGLDDAGRPRGRARRSAATPSIRPSASATARIEPSRDSFGQQLHRRVSMLPLFRISGWFIQYSARGRGRLSALYWGHERAAARMPPPRPGLAGAQGGALMAAASMSCVQLGLALSVPLFGQLGLLGRGQALRLAWAGLILVVLVRPRLAALRPAGPAGLLRAGRGHRLLRDAAVHARDRAYPARQRRARWSSSGRSLCRCSVPVAGTGAGQPRPPSVWCC